jgi:oligopeptide transport system substrate-binding protein
MKNKVIFILLFIIALSNCNTDKNNEQLVLKDVWKLEQAQINSFDPLDAYHAYHIQLVKQLFNTLTDLDSTGKIIPSLAVSWKTENGKDWIFHLRDDVWFIHDPCFSKKEERKFSAEDVKYTFERLLSPSSKSLGVSYFTNISGVKEYMSGSSASIQGIRLIDNHSISFNLVQPDYNFPNLLSLPYCSIVKEEAIEKTDSKQHPVGTGPFILEKYLSNQSVSLIKNPEYWEKSGNVSLPVVDQVEIALTTDDNYSFLLFKNQKTDFLELNLPLTKQLESSNLSFNYQKNVIESAQLNFYLFNLEKIQNPEIRKGINYAIDRSKMQKLLGDNGTIIKSLYPKVFKGVSQPAQVLEHNKANAEKLLTKPMVLKLVAFDDILSRSLASQIREDLKPFSIDVEIEAVPFSVLVDRLTSGHYDMIQLYWGMLYADINHFLTPFKTSSFPPAGNNFNKYSNSQFDSIVSMASQKTEDQQSELYKQAETIILEDMPFVLTYYKNVTHLSNKKYILPMNPLLYKYYKNAVPVE